MPCLPLPVITFEGIRLYVKCATQGCTFSLFLRIYLTELVWTLFASIISRGFAFCNIFEISIIDSTKLISCCLEEAFNDDTIEKVTELDEKVKALQVELIGYKAYSNEAHKLGLEIIALREERDKLLAETALQKQRLKEIEEMAKVFDGLSGPLQTYDESYVRQLISRIDIYDDKVTITFKDGQAIDINE